MVGKVNILQTIFLGMILSYLLKTEQVYHKTCLLYLPILLHIHHK